MSTTGPAAEPTVDELTAQAEQRRAAGARLPEIVAGIKGVGYDQRKLVRATVTVSGELRGLTLHPAALSFGGRELGRMVVAAAGQAAEFARQRAFNELALVLGDNATAELEELIGPSPARAAGWDTVRVRTAPGPTTADPAPPPPTSQDDDHDDPFSFDPSSLRSDR